MSSKTRLATHPEHAFQDPEGLQESLSIKKETNMAQNKRKREATEQDERVGSNERNSRRLSFRPSPLVEDATGGDSSNDLLHSPQRLGGDGEEEGFGGDRAREEVIVDTQEPHLDHQASESPRTHHSNILQRQQQLIQQTRERVAQQNGDDEGSNAAAAAATSTAAAALAGIYPNMSLGSGADVSFASSAATEAERNLESALHGADEDGHNHSMPQEYIDALSRGQTDRDPTPKPPVGSDEWHRVRRDNHKEVERRRRETINEGINELAKIVPNCEKNKGHILQRAVAYIAQLKERETQHFEKRTLEKLLTEQAIAELSSSLDKLKGELERAWQEAESWKKLCEEASLTSTGNEGGD